MECKSISIKFYADNFFFGDSSLVSAMPIEIVGRVSKAPTECGPEWIGIRSPLAPSEMNGAKVCAFPPHILPAIFFRLISVRRALFAATEMSLITFMCNAIN